MKINNRHLLHRFIAFLSVAFQFGLVSCTKDFEKMNQDPIRPSTVNPGNMLGQLEYRLVNTTIATSKQFTHELMQVTAPRESSSGGLHRYVVLPGTGTGMWNDLYARMTDLGDLEKISSESHPNYQAVAMILKAWAYSLLTDAFGPIPYSEAARAEEGIVAPKFDGQKEVYIGLLDMLAKANDLIRVDEGLAFGGDLLYGDDQEAMLKWKKLANSMRLRLLLRIIRRDGEMNVRGEIAEILNDAQRYPLFASNGDEAILRYTGSYPYYNPYYNARTLDWRQGDYYTSFFIDRMITTGDPRLKVWATTVEEGGNRIYSGIQSGYLPDVVYVTDRHSSYNDNLKTTPILGLIMTYAELEFIRAELSLRGFDTGASARAHYEQGVKASMQQWQTSVDESYVNQDLIKYLESSGFEEQLNQIITQKYYSLFFVDMQSWFEKRRTGYPVLPRGEGIPLENTFPSRLVYPTYLQSLNATNLEQAIQSLGGADRSTVIGWWEKQ